MGYPIHEECQTETPPGAGIIMTFDAMADGPRTCRACYGNIPAGDRHLRRVVIFD